MSLLLLFRPHGAGAPPAAASIACTAATETDIRAGAKTVTITISNDTWQTAGAAFDGERQNIINGLTSAGAEAAGWNAVVKALQGVAGVVRTSDTVVTITLDAQATYDITAPETITVTVPFTALATSLSDVVGTPTFTITDVQAQAAAEEPTGVKRGRKRQVIVRLAEVVNREDTATFLKNQLKLRHQDSAFEEPEPAKVVLSGADQERNRKRAAEAMRAMEIEAANEERRVIERQNAEILKTHRAIEPMTPEEALKRSKAAERIFNDPLVQETLDIMEKEVMEAWMNCPIRDVEAREAAWRLAVTTRKFRDLLRGTMESGKLAADAIARKKTALERVKQTFSRR